MIKVNETSPIHSPAKLKKKRSDDDSGFGALLDAAEESDAPSSSRGSAPTQNIDTLNSLLSLQEVSDEELSKQRAMQSGYSALDSLEELRRELLFGDISQQTVEHMQQRLSNLRQALPGDETLKHVIDDIELRLAVELAKLEQQ